MVIAPQHDWSIYELLTRAEHRDWLRGLSPQERFALCAHMFNMIHYSRDPQADWDELDQWHWEQKLAARMRQVEAFTKLDQFRSERAAANNAG